MRLSWFPRKGKDQLVWTSKLRLSQIYSRDAYSLLSNIASLDLQPETRMIATTAMIWYIQFQFIAVVAIIFFVGCKSRDAIIDNKEYASLEQIVDSRNFEVQNNWALPLRGNQINLIGNDNFIKFSNDSVSLFLPYFGVRQMAGGYNSAVVSLAEVTNQLKSPMSHPASMPLTNIVMRS